MSIANMDSHPCGVDSSSSVSVIFFLIYIIASSASGIPLHVVPSCIFGGESIQSRCWFLRKVCLVHVCRWAADQEWASTSTWPSLEAWSRPWEMQNTWLPSGTPPNTNTWLECDLMWMCELGLSGAGSSLTGLW